MDVALYFVWGIAAVVWGSDPAPDLDVSLVLSGVAGALLVVLWVRTVMAVALVVTRRDRKRTTAQKLAWLVFPAILALTFIGSATGTFFTTRVYLSRSAMRAYAEAPASSTTQPSDQTDSKQWIGLFKVKRVERISGCTAFITRSFVKSFGVLYRPEGVPLPGGRLPNGRRFSARHLFGPWYRYKEELN